MCHSGILVFLFVLIQTSTSLHPTPPLTESPLLLESFIPAGMQILAHVTELMKYDLRPQTGSTVKPGRPTSTTTQQPPTPAHRPGVYAPQKPLGYLAYYSNQREFSYRDYVQQLKKPSGENYFSRYPSIQRNLEGEDNIPVEFYLYFGKSFTDLLRLANKVEPIVETNDIDIQAQEFSKDFDDDAKFRLELLRQKQVPPTRAYVTLLSLYDMLNKESKKLNLNKYQGYTDEILRELIDSSISTSAYQLRTILNKIVQHTDTRDPNILKKIKQIIEDIDEHDSYMNKALKYIPPLAFVA